MLPQTKNSRGAKNEAPIDEPDDPVFIGENCALLHDSPKGPAVKFCWSSLGRGPRWTHENLRLGRINNFFLPNKREKKKKK